jgi:uncharacterized protein YbjQ (UPF0145 family)
LSDDKPKKGEDLTRIEDLSEFLHSEDDDFSGLSTDPDMNLPDGFSAENTDHDDTDFSSLEENFEDAPEDELIDNGDTLSDDFTNQEFQSDNDEIGFGDDQIEEESFETGFDEGSEFGDIESFDDPNEAFSEETSEDVADDFSDFSSEDLSDDEDNESQLFTDEVGEPEEQAVEELEVKEDVKESLSEPQVEVNAEPPELKSMEVPATGEPAKPYAPPETFRDLQTFSKNMSYGNLSHEGNPPFSIILKDIKFQEDLDDIIIYLKEFKIHKEEDEQSARKTLSRGSFLIPRLSEYAAILLCHKLRRFELTILMGLTEEITPAKSYSSDDSGLATKNNIYNNRSHNWVFEKKEVTLADILTCNTASAEGYEVQEYLGVATEFAVIDIQDLSGTEKNEDSIQESLYSDLVEKLKSHAINKNGNAVVGINYTLTPLVKEHTDSSQQYKVTCTGNIVWLLKK